MTTKRKIGYTCAYAPLALIEAAGFIPFRLLPIGEPPDQAGRLLHDNLCPHVKKVLDRAMDGSVPDLAGTVFMNSCDAMRRLADVWPKALPESRSILVDLPVTTDENAVRFFASELRQLSETLTEWGGDAITEDILLQNIERRNELADVMDKLEAKLKVGDLFGGTTRLQILRNLAMTEGIEQALSASRELLGQSEEPPQKTGDVPVFLFGNVMPDPETFSLFESCGVHIIADDLCTGSRQFTGIDIAGDGDIYEKLARGILNRPICARTLDPVPGKLAREVIASTLASGAKGVICHVVKFCDPYLARLPDVRNALRKEGLPLLILEGDCTLRSIGQQRTRIEAFVEMLR